jgi:hypothetical protein
MYKFKVFRFLKGNVSLYALIIGMLCILMSLVALKFETDKIKYIENLKNEMEMENKVNNYRETLFSLFYNQYLVDKKTYFTEENIRNYLRDNYSYIKVDSDNSRLYMKNPETIIIEYKIDNYYKQAECYNYVIANSKISFNKIQSVVLAKDKSL